MSTTGENVKATRPPTMERSLIGLATFVGNGSLYIEDLKWNSSPWGCDLLEVVHVGLVIEPKEGYGVGHHPDVPPAAVVVGFVPLSVLVAHSQDLLLLHHDVARVDNLLVKTWQVTHLTDKNWQSNPLDREYSSLKSQFTRQGQIASAIFYCNKKLKLKLLFINSLHLARSWMWQSPS